MYVYRITVSILLISYHSYLWDVVVSSLSLFLLQFDGNTTYWSSLDTLHQMGNKAAIGKYSVK